tara:strand:+ start:239 stop:982 length:744 start_codon:yes stop_codon:yes gene_type:complete
MVKKKNILITGSSRGIGLSIAEKLYKDEYNQIFINGRNKKKLENLKKKKLANCEIALGDINNSTVLKKINKKIKRLDVLICNIGSGRSKITGKETKQDWEKSLSQNFYSSVNTIKVFEKKLIKSKGIIICISSICGMEFIKGAPITYSVSKAALNAFVRFYSKYLGTKGVRLNAIAPGNILFKGSTWEKKLQKNKRMTLNQIDQEVSLKRFGTAEDIANLVNYLIKDNSKFINGSIIVADGGQIRGL